MAFSRRNNQRRRVNPGVRSALEWGEVARARLKELLGENSPALAEQAAKVAELEHYWQEYDPVALANGLGAEINARIWQSCPASQNVNRKKGSEIDNDS